MRISRMAPVLLALAFSASSLQAQATPTEHLPAWHGSWAGSCQATGADQSEPFGMRLEVGPMKESIRLSWRTTLYPPDQDPQVGDHLMIPTTRPGQYVLDQQNGVGIDTVAVGNLLFQNFYTSNTGRATTSRWEVRGDRIEMEMSGFAVRPGRNTVGPGGVQVTSFGLVSLQRCTLTRE